MRIALVHVTTSRKNVRAARDEIVDVERLTIGRGTANTLSVRGLSVRLEHCVIEPANRAFQVRPLDGAAVKVNRTYTTGPRQLDAGDVVRVGQTEIRLAEPRDDVDLVLEIERVGTSQATTEQLAARTRLGINRGLLSRSVLSTAAVLLVGVLFAGLPLADVALRARNQAPPAGLAPVTAGLLASWSSGPISSNHAHLSQRCQACHTVGFERVANHACTECHAGIAAHAPQAMDAAHEITGRCVDCHREHRGEALMDLQDDLCVDCHADLSNLVEDSSLLAVADFTAAHPEFRPSLFVDPPPAARRRVALDEAPRENSGLNFSHRKHLEPGLRSPLGRVTLACDACHLPEGSGALMRPIRFEETCRACHTLGFDPDDPRQVAPHASVQEVRAEVFESFAARALQREAEAAPTPAWRRAGRPQSREPAATTAPSAWAEARARTALEQLLGAAGECRRCHAVDQDRGLERISVRVLPLAQPEAAGLRPEENRWLPHARFSHATHRYGLECEHCHAVRDSDSSADVSLPAIDTCRACHGEDVPDAGRVAANCLECHGFHLQKYGPMQSEAR